VENLLLIMMIHPEDIQKLVIKNNLALLYLESMMKTEKHLLTLRVGLIPEVQSSRLSMEYQIQLFLLLVNKLRLL
jgi:hypothetical protein